jgi:ankyrin repeat protein
LGDNPTQNQKLLSGALHGSPRVVIEAIDSGADVNYKQSLALQYAVMNNDIELVRFLVRMGSDIPSNISKRDTSDKILLFLDRVKKLSELHTR